MKKSLRYRFLPWILSAVFASVASAGMIPDVTYHFEPNGFKGDSTRMVVHVSLPAGWHIQSDAPLDSFLIATTVKATGEGLLFGPPVFPKPVIKNYPGLGGNVAMFTGEFDIRVPVARTGPQIKASALKSVKVKLGYQACNDTQCLPPKEVDAKFESKILGKRGPEE